MNAILQLLLYTLIASTPLFVMLIFDGLSVKVMNARAGWSVVKETLLIPIAVLLSALATNGAAMERINSVLPGTSKFSLVMSVVVTVLMIISFINYIKLSLLFANYLGSSTFVQIVFRLFFSFITYIRVKKRNKELCEQMYQFMAEEERRAKEEKAAREAERRRYEHANASQQKAENFSNNSNTNSSSTHEEELKRENDRLRREFEKYKRAAEDAQNNAYRRGFDSGKNSSSSSSKYSAALETFCFEPDKKFTKKELDKTRNILIKRLHPDTARGPEEQEKLTELAVKINTAYEILLPYATIS